MQWIKTIQCRDHPMDHYTKETIIIYYDRQIQAELFVVTLCSNLDPSQHNLDHHHIISVEADLACLVAN